jgi:uracil-DNA glycosylase
MMSESRKLKLGESWYNILDNEFSEPYMIKLNNILKNEYSKYTIRPNLVNIFRAFRECSYENTKVCIIGQDPYPNEHANGLSFASDVGVPVSLRLIFHELEKFYGFNSERTNNLDYLVKQGVLLLNTRLTTRDSQPNSHKDIGWEIFIIRVIDELLKKDKIVFLTLGSNAFELIRQHKGIEYKKNLFVCEHPSYAAREERNWKSNDCFKLINHYLDRNNLTQINW